MSCLLLVLSLVASYPAQQNIDWKSFLYLSKDARDRLIEEITKNSALLLNQKNGEVVKLPQATAPIGLAGPIVRRPTEDDDLLFLKKMKEQTDAYQRETAAVSGFVPAPPYVPPPPYYFLPHPNFYPLLSSRIFARPAPLLAEEQIRQQLPLRGIYSQ